MNSLKCSSHGFGTIQKVHKKKKKKVDLRQIWSSNELSPHLQSNYYIQYKHMTIMVQGL